MPHSRRRRALLCASIITLALLPLLALPAFLSATEAPPDVITTLPPNDATDTLLDTTLIVTFTEPVTLTTNALQLDCTHSSTHATTTSGGPVVYHFQPTTPFQSGERCAATIFASEVSDHDADDPPDHMFVNYEWAFTTATTQPAPDHVLINEADAHTSDDIDFIELYDGGPGRTDLTGLLLALYEGETDTVYAVLDLNGYTTDANGYLLITTADLTLPAPGLHNGPAAITLYAAEAAFLPIGSPLTTNGLLDALVYDTGQPDDPQLLQLLQPDQPQVNENGRHNSPTHSNQRCPNGTGGQRQTDHYLPNHPTPQATNNCTTDTSPDITAKSPPEGAFDVFPNTTLTLTFTEPVLVSEQTFQIDCALSGRHPLTLSGTDAVYTLDPVTDFAYGEQCTVTTLAQHVHDADSDDPPDTMFADDHWQFTTLPSVADHIVINELDADTPGSDTAEFIELYDGGTGHTDLTGLALVLFNGSDHTSYRTFDLDGLQTDEQGYFVLGNAAVPGVDLIFADTVLQNGPDAAALYNASQTHFPNGTPITATIATSIRLIDALVYGRSDQPDNDLLRLMNPGQFQVDEDGRNDQDNHALQRCPNGSGNQRNSVPFKQNTPTPGAINNCLTDTAPTVATTIPANNETIIPINSTIRITFNEPVHATGAWYQIECVQSGTHSAAVTGGPQTFTLTLSPAFATEERCTVRVVSTQINDLDLDDPPDRMAQDFTWSFTTAPPVADFVLINELDSDTASTDTAEFIELFDGGHGQTDLTGLTLVFFNGSTDTSYYAIDLLGYHTDNNGYFLLGNPNVPGTAITFPDNALQNGADAVALYAARATAFPNGSPLTTAGLIDAIVYDTADPDDNQLLALLNSGQLQVNEHGRTNSETHALQRCPNGSGGRRNTQTFRPDLPTPKAANVCTFDTAPTVESVAPIAGATAIHINAAITITFSEPVNLMGEWHDLTCTTSGRHSLGITGGPSVYSAVPTAPFTYNESCAFTIRATNIHDQDEDDPPDTMAANYTWSFTTAPPPATHILINELDSDTTSTDTAEFIELYDGGNGNTSLTGLTLVFYNGADDKVYQAIALNGSQTNSQGYFVIGNSQVPRVNLVIANGVLQNGPDAVALYARPATDFPTGSPITANGLLDAIVYSAQGGEASTQLLSLLHSGQLLVNENGRNHREGDSNQRCPNATGGQRNTATFLQDHPTPGLANDCSFDTAPQVTSVTPTPGSNNIPANTVIEISFSEPVLVQTTWSSLECDAVQYSLSFSGGPQHFVLTPIEPLAPGATCTATITAAQVSDLDQDDPPNFMSADYRWQFTIVEADIAEHMLINEVDSDTAESDTAEFIELYDGGAGGADLTGLVLVFFNGSDDLSYRAIDLTGQQTDVNGYFVLGNAAVPTVDLIFPNNTLQNGPDAVALYAGTAANFPTGSPLTADRLLDALVYDTADPDDPALLSLLNPDQPQVDENGRGDAEAHSNGRCPNGSGGQRNTTSYLQNQPTPGTNNDCTFDSSPTITGVSPDPGSTEVPINTPLQINFSEPVTTVGSWFTINCTNSGSHTAIATGGPQAFVITPNTPYQPAETCTVSILATAIHDVDQDDPPDELVANYTWQFTTAVIQAADFVLINEVDTDTEGSDTAEFIELYDGGMGGTDLSGLVVVFFNGSDDLSYRAIDLSGQQSDANGYFVLGNLMLPGVDLTFPDNTLQNGPDAVALYVKTAANFPNGSPLTTNGLLDALVYDTADPDDPVLLTLLNPSQPQVDESGRNSAEGHSNGRCPNGSGGQRNTVTYIQNHPTPGANNNCTFDIPPTVTGVSPNSGAAEVPINAQLQINFSEPVMPLDSWFTINCTNSGDHTADVTGGPQEFLLTPNTPYQSAETCTTSIIATAIHDLDQDDPPDTMVANYTWQFTTEAIESPNFILINEVDADTPSSDTAEFIELYDGGRGNTDLSGLVLVLYNGTDDAIYHSFNLTAYKTDATGYFVLGNSNIPDVDFVFSNGLLQNGPDAVALYAATPAAFPNGDPPTTQDLLDALVYGTDDPVDNDLLVLLNNGQPQVDENGRGAAETDANQRCPDGAGGQRQTASYLQNRPTPGTTNDCTFDPPPTVANVSPSPTATQVPINTPIDIHFSEPVSTSDQWIDITCSSSGHHTTTQTNGPQNYTIHTTTPFHFSENCTITLLADHITDLDTDDPPDTMTANFSWQFTTLTPQAPDFILINEVDADTEGSDTAEFIELYDGGVGHTNLSGLVLVFYNGSDDVSYRTLDLSGHQTDTSGYFLLGNEAVTTADLTFANGQLQNGPDAIALYATTTTDFPNGSPLTTNRLLDALVYGTDQEPDPELLTLLHPGQPQVNENGRHAKDLHSNQRCPNGTGGQRNTATYLQNPPTPKMPNNCVVDAAPTVVQVTPPPNANNIDRDTTLTITFSEAVQVSADPFTLNCTISGSLRLTIQGGPDQYTLTPTSPLSPGERCDATIHAAAISDLDTDDPPNHLATDYVWSFTTTAPACGQPATPIHTIQGHGHTSPLDGEADITIEAAVTLTSPTGLNGFFLQEEPHHTDRQPTTSQAIFVTTGNSQPAQTITSGDIIRLTGKIAERNGRTTLINPTNLTICATGHTTTPLTITLPITPTSSWEHIESMLINLPQTLTVIHTADLHTQGIIELSTNGRQYQPTQMTLPGTDAQAWYLDNQSRRILLDDTQTGPPLTPLPYISTNNNVSNTLRIGDTTANLTGILDHIEDSYRIQPTRPVDFIATNPRPPQPLPTNGRLTIASLDLDGYFNTGATTPAELERQQAKLIAALTALDADLIALTGLENDQTAPQSALHDLLLGLNTAISPTTYAALAPSTWPATTPTQPALLYRPDILTPEGTSSSLPPSAFAQSFTEQDTGEHFTLVVTQFVGRDCPAADNDDPGDGQGCNNAARTTAAHDLLNWLATNPTSSTDPDLLIVGALHTYTYEDPMAILVNGGYEDLVEQFLGRHAYTAVANGQSAHPDHALASPTLALQTAHLAIWHINADEPPALDYRTTNPPTLYQPDPFRSAAHDPILLGLNLQSLTAAFTHNGPVPIGQTSHFTSTATGPGTLTHTWDFGDGTQPATGTHAAHTYATPGLYTVTLTANNGFETATAAMPHTVSLWTLYLPIQTLPDE